MELFLLEKAVTFQEVSSFGDVSYRHPGVCMKNKKMVLYNGTAGFLWVEIAGKLLVGSCVFFIFFFLFNHHGLLFSFSLGTATGSKPVSTSFEARQNDTGTLSSNVTTERFEIVDVAAFEKKMLDLLNEERKKRGLPLLEDDPGIGEVSYNHSLKMAKEKKLSHSFPGYPELGERLHAVGLSYITAGENVAFSQYYEPQKVHDGFMASPRHRDNIINPSYTHCAIRVVQDGRDLYITQEFAQLFMPLKAEEILKILEQELAAGYKKKYGYGLLLLPVVREYARESANRYLQGRQVKAGHPGWGNFNVIHFLSPDIHLLKQQLVEETGKVYFQAAALGAAVGKQPGKEGMTYAVTAILFPGLKYPGITEEEMPGKVLQALDEVRERYGRKQLILEKTLSKEAQDTAKLYYDYPGKWSEDTTTQQMLIYQTYDPLEIPAEFSEILGKPKKMKVGIGVFSPLWRSLPGNYYIVCIIIGS